MAKQRFCYFYKIESINDKKSVVSEISKLEGVISCEIKDDTLFYEITEWTNEYDILTASMDICERFGGELIVGDEVQNPVAEENEEVDTQVDSHSIVLNDSENAVEDNDVLIDSAKNTELNLENENNSSDEETSSDDETIKLVEDDSFDDKKKKLKIELITRFCELGVSLILLILGLAIPSNGDNIFTFSTIVLIFSFAISIYEVFYYGFLACLKKQFYNPCITVAFATVGMVLFGKLFQASLIAIVFAVALAFKTFYSRYRENKICLELIESGMEEKTAIEEAAKSSKQLEISGKKTMKVFSVFGYLALLLTVFSFFCLIPNLKLTDYAPSLFGIAVLLAMLADDFVIDCVLNCLVFSKLNGIDFKDKNILKKIGQANAIEVDASILTENGKVNDLTIGAMKELVSLGVKSIKTNFDVKLSQEVADEIDFVDKDFSGKKLITAGESERDINFKQSSTGANVEGDLTQLPLTYRVAKLCKTIKTFSNIISRVSVLALLAIPVLMIVGAMNYSLIVAAVGIGLYAISECLALINTKVEY